MTLEMLRVAPSRFASLILLGTLVTACHDQPRSNEAPATTPVALVANAAPAMSDSARADELRRARQDSINRTLPGYVVDSIFPVEEELRRFRKALGGDSALVFNGGSPSRDALIRRFVTALAASDTNEFRNMVVHGREFADLYYPVSPYSRAPYRQPPQLAWSLIQNPSTDGLTKLLRTMGGKPITYVAHKCDPKVVREGRITRYSGCIVQIADAKGDTTTRLMFGSIVELGGVYKFLSYTNRL
ncbi:MAG TPA: hypothetical protein VF461_22810 [Gemmatimonadaceae bacterium]